MSKEKHEHAFTEPTTKKVLLHRYESEDGQAKPVDTTGYDILRQLKCVCGAVETLDLERTKV